MIKETGKEHIMNSVNKKQKTDKAAAKEAQVRVLRLKPVHFKKLAAITEVKTKALFSKNFIIMPIFAIGFTFVMKLIYGSTLEGVPGMSAYCLAMGVLMNICMTALYCPAGALAEEKEKHTLRTLMTSSVNGLEFFLGSLIPVILLTSVVNVICVFIAGMEMDAPQWAVYVAVTTVSAAIGAVIGMIFGIFAKDQVTTGTIITPAVLVLMMIPMFCGFSEILEKISDLLFTGIVFNMLANLAEGITPIDTKGIIVLAAGLILSVIAFLALYRKNGFER